MNHDADGAAAPALPPDTPAPVTPWAAYTAPPRWQPLAIEFTGSGSEYFRIWVVNMLLVIVTFSLYLPFAKARRLRYFHGNTLVGGQALGFHGQGSTMLRGYLLVLGFAGCYALAGHFSPLAAGLAGLALALLWPALWQASLRFRLANTSWRGIRLRFTGSVGGAYLALLPMLLPGALFLLLSGLRGMGDAEPGAAPAAVGRWADGVVAACVLLLMSASPWLTARLKRYQHGHYQFAGETTALSARTGQFYGLSFRAGLMAMGPIVLLGVGMALLNPLDAVGRDPRMASAMAGLVSLVLVFYGLLLCVVQPWWAARLQDLVWGNTASPRLKFSSNLRARDLVWLTVKNLLLTVLTLGLYRPFAVVATTRLRLQAMALQSLGPVDHWVAGQSGRADDASGDAAGDLLGVDLGL